MSKSVRRRRAFTLVELLVVIGIIAVLIGILLPTIARARRQANTTACMATLRNLGQALYIYAGDNKGSFPYSFYVVNGVASGGTSIAGESDSDVADRSVYVWWSVLRGYMRKNGNMDNSTLNNDGSRATRFMRAFACPEGHDPDAGCDYGSNPVIFPDLNWEGAPTSQGVNYKKFNAPISPGKLNQLYPDNILLFDQTEIADTDPPFGRQYVTGYSVDTSPSQTFGSLMNPKKAYQRYRGMAADPAFIAPGSDLDNGVPIYAGSNKEAANSAPSQRGNVRWRHGKEDSANFLFADGTVRTMYITKGTPGKPDCRGEVLHKFWRIKDPPGFVKNG